METCLRFHFVIVYMLEITANNWNFGIFYNINWFHAPQQYSFESLNEATDSVFEKFVKNSPERDLEDPNKELGFKTIEADRRERKLRVRDSWVLPRKEYRFIKSMANKAVIVWKLSSQFMPHVYETQLGHIVIFFECTFNYKN